VQTSGPDQAFQRFSDRGVVIRRCKQSTRLASQRFSAVDRQAKAESHSRPFI
jgi:hypothetical protein